MFNVVLFHPKIPHNTGAIGRLCVNSDSMLHLVKPLGFNIDDKSIRRTGLDYWQNLNLKVYSSKEDFFAQNSGGSFYYLTTKTDTPYFKTSFKPDDFLIFGSEDKGIDEDILKANNERTLTIPMGKNGRSLNLAISVGIVLYEAIRQNY